jgi:catechol 2,3-dioxygenase-like lactoylglutathione lyase family enzyme
VPEGCVVEEERREALTCPFGWERVGARMGEEGMEWRVAAGTAGDSGDGHGTAAVEDGDEIKGWDGWSREVYPVGGLPTECDLSGERGEVGAYGARDVQVIMDVCWTV